jgi:hypothetical protein
MSGGEAFSTFLFLCIFEVLGGAAVGAFVRTLLRREPPGMSLFFLIWGAGFAGIPLLIGGVMLLTSERPALFFAQVFVFLMAVVLVALMPSELFDKDADGNMPTAIVGAVLILFGAAFVLLTPQDGVGVGTLIGAAVGFGGVVVLLRAVFGVLRPA